MRLEAGKILSQLTVPPLTPRIGRSLGRAVILIGPDDWRLINVTSPRSNYRTKESNDAASLVVAGKKYACIEFKIQLHPCKNVSDYALDSLRLFCSLSLSSLSSRCSLPFLFALFRSRYTDCLLQNHNLGGCESEQAACKCAKRY